jgi:hypothetical protein
MRRFLPCLVLSLALSTPVLAQPDGQSVDGPVPASKTPAWLPRGAFLGTFLNEGVVLPQAQLQWEIPFYQTRNDGLYLIFEGGGGLSVATPDKALPFTEAVLDSVSLYTVMGGAGYRNQRPGGWHWGFHVVTGPAFYGARFLTSTPQEDYFVGFLEGRAQVGHSVGPFVLGAAVGYGSSYNYRRRSVARPYVGGLQVGLFADWQ